MSSYLWERYPAKIRAAIDIGGHVGWWTRLLKMGHPGASVAVIEPDVESFALLRRNTTHDPSIMLYNAACGYLEGPMSIVRDPGNSGATHLVRSDEAAARAAGGEWLVQDNVSLMSLETAMDALTEGLIDVVKCDCEGSEYDIFGNVPLAYLRRIRCIVGEHHGRVERFRAEIGARFEAAGFTLSYVAHPNPEVRELGMFFAEYRAPRSAQLRALWRRLWPTR